METSSTLHVFLSSTWLDLQTERETVEKALQRMREIKFIGMEYFGSRPEDPLASSLEEVRRCNLYIGIIGQRYGSGITEAEYHEAQAAGLPSFVYFKKTDDSLTTGKDENTQKLESFKSAIHNHHIVADFSTPDQLAALVVTDLHRWISDNIFSKQLQEAEQGKLSIHQMNELAEGVKALTTLVKSVQSTGTRSVAIGGNNTGIIHTGDVIFQVFSHAPRGISNYIRVREFKSLIQERTKDFVGREFVFDAIDEILKDKEGFPSGYIVVQGEPGIGKTSLSAQLVKTRGYIHHFNIGSQNIRSVHDFLANTCAQLIVHYELDYSTIPDTATKDSGFLSRLLDDVASKKLKEPVVIVIDALDEVEDTGLSANDNRLLLPNVLPKGIFFLITTRPKYEYRLNVDNRRDIFISDEDPRNQEDIKDYIVGFLKAHQQKMSQRLAELQVSEDGFKNVIIERSQGNFMYMVHVLRDIREGVLTIQTMGSINKLPKGLKEYYQRHWRFMRVQEPERFRNYYEPVVCILATAREAVPVSQIVEWTKKEWPELNAGDIRDVIRHWWEFLNEDTSQEPPLYRIYHTSFQDFLKEEVGLEYYHRVIALSALSKVPGLKLG